MFIEHWLLAIKMRYSINIFFMRKKGIFHGVMILKNISRIIGIKVLPQFYVIILGGKYFFFPGDE